MMVVIGRVARTRTALSPSNISGIGHPYASKVALRIECPIKLTEKRIVKHCSAWVRCVIPLTILASDNRNGIDGRSIPDQMCADHFVVFSSFKQSIGIN